MNARLFLALSVGKLIVTKKIGQEVLPGLEDMEDITEIYKNPYGTIKTIFLIISQLFDVVQIRILAINFSQA